MAKITVESTLKSNLEAFVNGILYVNDSSIEVQWVDDNCIVIMDDDKQLDEKYFIDEFGTLVDN